MEKSKRTALKKEFTLQSHKGDPLSDSERQYVAELIAQMIVDKINRQSRNISITTNREDIHDN